MSDSQLIRPLRWRGGAPQWAWILVLVVLGLVGACTDSSTGIAPTEPDAGDATQLSFVARDPSVCVWTVGQQILVSIDPNSCEGATPMPEAEIDVQFPRWDKPGAAAAVVLLEDVVIVVIDGAEKGDQVQVGAVTVEVADGPDGSPLVQISTREELLPECGSGSCGLELRITQNGKSRSAQLTVPTADEMGLPDGETFDGLVSFESFES